MQITSQRCPQSHAPPLHYRHGRSCATSQLHSQASYLICSSVLCTRLTHFVSSGSCLVCCWCTVLVTSTCRPKCQTVQTTADLRPAVVPGQPTCCIHQPERSRAPPVYLRQMGCLASNTRTTTCSRTPLHSRAQHHDRIHIRCNGVDFTVTPAMPTETGKSA